ncbi:hypothetical protein RRG08_032468 [Elysia crispata]|uniref:Uncharacterized protein n=1 Tax=Elysia crispata TaxID=231223 RepID=A0AAE1BAB3_9GAST|nr:hypothetical protein RRG08_032468 [Elysia crispata]
MKPLVLYAADKVTTATNNLLLCLSSASCIVSPAPEHSVKKQLLHALDGTGKVDLLQQWLVMFTDGKRSASTKSRKPVEYLTRQL